jgi:hypothetical protein
MLQRIDHDRHRVRGVGSQQVRELERTVTGHREQGIDTIGLKAKRDAVGAIPQAMYLSADIVLDGHATQAEDVGAAQPHRHQQCKCAHD